MNNELQMLNVEVNRSALEINDELMPHRNSNVENDKIPNDYRASAYGIGKKAEDAFYNFFSDSHIERKIAFGTNISSNTDVSRFYEGHNTANIDAKAEGITRHPEIVQPAAEALNEKGYNTHFELNAHAENNSIEAVIDQLESNGAILSLEIDGYKDKGGFHRLATYNPQQESFQLQDSMDEDLAADVEEVLSEQGLLE